MSERPLELRSAIDTADGRDEMILGNWQRLAAAAWTGFLDDGRGALLLDLRAAPKASTWNARKLVGLIVRAIVILIGSKTPRGVTVQSTYLPIDLLRSGDDADSTLQDMINYVENYDPTRGMVLFIKSAGADGDVVRCRSLHSESALMLNPPDAYQAERRIHRNDPRSS